MTPPDEPSAKENRTRQMDRRLAGGVAWTAGAKWATQLFSWGAVFVVGRYLSQANVGLGDMAGFFFILSNTLAEFGVGTATLHMAELDEDTLHQLHGFSLLLCAGIYGLSVLAAPYIAAFFHSPHLALFLDVNNLAFLVTGFQAVPTGLLQRSMDYRRLSLSEAVMSLVQSSVTIVAALLGGGTWALITGVLAGKTANAVMVLWWQPVGFAFPHWKNLRAPMEFGRRAAIGQLAWSAYGHSDILVIGRILGDSALGTYRMAMNLASGPAEKISMLIMRTAGPLFANLQDDPALVRRYFLLLAETLNLAVVPAMAGLIVVAPDAISATVGIKWAASVQPLIWLAAYMIFSTMNSLVLQILLSQRQTRFTMRMNLLNMVVMPVALATGAWWHGTTGAAAAWVLATPLTILPPIIVLVRRIGLRGSDYLQSAWPTLASACAMVLALIGLRHAIAPLQWTPLVRLIAQIATGSVVYVAMLLGFFREKILRYVRFLRGLRGGATDDTKQAPAETAEPRNLSPAGRE